MRFNSRLLTLFPVLATTVAAHAYTWMLYQAPDSHIFAAVYDPTTNGYAALFPLDYTLPTDLTSLSIGEAFDSTNLTIAYTEATGNGAFAVFDFTGKFLGQDGGFAPFTFAGIADLTGAGTGQFIIKEPRLPYNDLGTSSSAYFDVFKIGAFNRVLGFADVNQDGKPDFVMENPTNHWVKGACFDGTTFIGPSFQVYKHAQTLRSWIGITQENFDFFGFSFNLLFAKGPGVATTVHVLDGLTELGHRSLPDKGMALLAVGPSYIPNSSPTFKKGTNPFPLSTSSDDE